MLCVSKNRKAGFTAGSGVKIRFVCRQTIKELRRQYAFGAFS